MRLNHKTIRPTGAAINIRFDGQVIPALAGETVAAALSAAGIVAFRQTPGGAPRGLHCGMGACFDCVVTIDGRTGQRACLAKVADGIQVSSAMPAAPVPLAPVLPRVTVVFHGVEVDEAVTVMDWPASVKTIFSSVEVALV